MALATASGDPLLAPAGHAECLLGNEAIVRGALERGVAFATGYPGTPSSEVTDSFARIAAARGIAFEYAVNEKIALELAFAASLAGARSICAMKHLGLMVAGDPLSTIPYIGVVGGLVIVSAGDPSLHTSPNEQDQRHLGPMLHVPILDPSSPAEALEMTRFAFELSEASRLPVILRTTTRVAHGRAVVKYGALRDPEVRGFTRAPERYVPIPSNARRMRLELKERIALARELLSASPFVDVDADGEVAVLASGAAAAVCRDLARDPALAGRFALWTVGAVHPLAEAPLAAALARVKRVLVVEELSPFLEDALLALSARSRAQVEILGKRSGHLPEEFELQPPRIEDAIRAAVGSPARERPRAAGPAVAPRPASLCPGCPHRAAYFAARAAFAEDQLFFNDIGCYTLGYGPPHQMADALLCMGAGFTLAAGVARVTGKRTVGFLGDSTFFHAGMPALLDAIRHEAEVVAVVLDNQVTAMTGFQESPAAVGPGQPGAVAIEDVARALGARHVEVIDPYDLSAAIAAFRRARDARGTSVVVARRACPVHDARQRGSATRPAAFVVDAARCRECGREEQGLRCDVPLTEGYERELARARAQRLDTASAPPVAPCAAACPLSLCVQGYAGHLAAGERAEALGHVLARTPLPESVCRVCDRPCEPACVRAGIDEPVAINELKRFVVSWAARERPDLLRVAPGPAHRASVAVVGAGPAGLSAALELRQRGYAVTLHDAADRPGGRRARGSPRYRLPAEARARDVARVLESGVTFVPSSRLGRDVTIDGLLARHDAVVVAVGAWRPKRLVLEGEGAPGAPARADALAYLAAVADGADAPRGRQVVVIGGGNAAVDSARTALRRGTESVVIACLEARAEMPALPDEIAAAEHEGVVILDRVRPGRFAPGALVVVPVGGSPREEAIGADLVIVAIGQEPELAFLETGAPSLGLGRDGLLAIDAPTGRTSDRRVFAAGDVVHGPRTVTGAIASGLRAAWGVDLALRGPDAASVRAPPALPGELASDAPVAFRAPQAPRVAAPELERASRTRSFDEVARGYTEEQARAEAARCLLCGACGNCRACIDTLACPAFGLDGGRVEVDALLCIACGVCARVCPDDALGPPRAGGSA